MTRRLCTCRPSSGKIKRQLCGNGGTWRLTTSMWFSSLKWASSMSCTTRTLSLLSKSLGWHSWRAIMLIVAFRRLRSADSLILWCPRATKWAVLNRRKSPIRWKRGLEAPRQTRLFAERSVVLPRLARRLSICWTMTTLLRSANIWSRSLKRWLSKILAKIKKLMI